MDVDVYVDEKFRFFLYNMEAMALEGEDLRDTCVDIYVTEATIKIFSITIGGFVSSIYELMKDDYIDDYLIFRDSIRADAKKIISRRS